MERYPSHWSTRTLASVFCLAATLLAVPGLAAVAQGPMPSLPLPPVDIHDISGYWELGIDDRSIPPAVLTPVAKRDEAKMRDADLISQRYCRPLGVPAMMDPGRPLSIAQGAYEVLITAPVNTAFRHFYFRDKHPDPAIYDPSSAGSSIAHWEGDTLVVDTIGFHEKNGRMMIPGGGYRTPDSHLVEKFKLIKDGQVLSVTSTWTDPKIFAQPHTYEFWYHRINSFYEPRPGIGCNPWDEQRASFIERNFSPSLKKKSDEEMVPPGLAKPSKY
jgi:hypothetical protein